VKQNVTRFINDPHEFRNRKGVGFLHINIRSLLSRHKLDHINILVSQANPDILVISETWLHKDIEDQTVYIQGYNIYRSDRASRGGGVAVYVKSTYAAVILNTVSIPKCFEFISLRIDFGYNNSIIVIGVYRPPSAPTMALNKMAELFMPFTDSELIVLGDFNLDWSTDASEALKEMSSDLHFTQLISVPTRPNLKDFYKSTLIDLIFCNKPEKYVANGVLDLGISDHCPIICIRDLRLQKCGSRVVMKRNFKHFDEQAFLHDLFYSDIADTVKIPDVDLALKHFTTAFNFIVDKHVPYKKCRTKDKVNPWYCNELAKLHCSRNKAWNLARQTNDHAHWLTFRQLRNKCTSAIRRGKADFYLQKFTESSNRPGDFWKAIKSLKGERSTCLPASILEDSTVLTEPSVICSAFNRHFAAAGHLFDKNVHTTDPQADPCTPPAISAPLSENSLSLTILDSAQVCNALIKIDQKKSTGDDKLDPFFLKTSATVIFEYITHIFNLSITTGVIPSTWKTAHVLPLHKGGDTYNMNNYRPISKLSCLSKILESLINSQLKSFLSLSSFLSPSQSGFRARHSTISAASLVVNDVIAALDNKQHCAALFVDLSKAFDTVDHHLLLNKLSLMGFDHMSLQWFKSYLTGRSQCVKVGKIISPFLDIDKGVPQGSVLGPLLFIIYINEIASTLTPFCQVHLYADDTVLHCSASNIDSAINSLQLSFHILEKQLSDLKLVLNCAKTKWILFTKARSTDFNSLKLCSTNGTTLERVTSYKYLGIWVDEKLDFKSHVKQLTKKLRIKLFFLYRNRCCFTFPARKRIIESVFISVLDYGDVIYGNASLSTLKTLDAVYHSALRFITGDRYGTHHCTLYNKVGWPALSERRDFHWKILIYKTIIGLMPPYLASLISWNRNTVNTRSLSLLTLHLPHANTKLGKTAFCFKAPFIWNEVQKSLRLCSFISLREFTSLIICTPAFSCNDCYS
jgi:exonuclease III